MIPLKLELHNFLAYRDPVSLDLTGLHVACLAGPNGAGKSSLLDAMTWALWGKARAQRDDELIHLGEVEMSVTLTFLLDGNVYRVTRYRSARGRGSSTLALHIQDGDEWRLLSGKSIRETQRQINHLLRLDYRTFINSAFLVQGRADEFTTKTPAERKEVLGDILGLESWQVYEQRARDRQHALENEIEQIGGQIQAIDEELTRETEYQRELIEAQQALETLVEQVREAERAYHELESAAQERESLRARYDDLIHRLERDEAELKRVREEHEQHLSRLDEYRQALTLREEIEAGYAALQEARQQERELNERLRQERHLSQQKHTLEQAIEAARSRLLADRQTLERRLSDLEQEIGKRPEEHLLQEARENVEQLEARERERDASQERLSEIKEELARLRADNRNLKAEMDLLARQKSLIADATEPVCPLCGQSLSEQHRDELLETLTRQGKEKAELWRANRDRIEALEEESEQLKKQIAAIAHELRNLPSWREHAARLEERLARAGEALEELEKVREQLAGVEASLHTGEYAQEEQAALAGVQDQLRALGYDEDAHEAARRAVEEYSGYEARRAELERILNALPDVEEAISRLDAQAAMWEERLAEDRASLEALAARIEELDHRLVDFERQEEELQRLREEEGAARVRVGAAEQRLSVLQMQRQRRVELIERRDRLIMERGIYEELRQAFSRDGIPAMIIEAAIPEIESEANQVLRRMTDGRMHIRFDTQREKVTGGVRETLDIKIADELGTRDYATFSGGEAFRVNFAIRLALSRLLARRAGAQLRTLIIDEGFGTQDAQGRERLIEAIHAIQDEFDLILVITHIDELKDAFPARIEVTKTERGSRIELV